MPSSLSLPLCVLMLSLKPSIAPSPCPTVPPSSASHGFKVLLHPYAIPFLMHAPSPFPTADLCMPGVNMSHRRREQSDIILSTFVHSSLTLSRKVRTFLEALTQLSPLWDMCSVILGWRFFKSRPNQSAKMNTKCQTSQNSLTSTWQMMTWSDPATAPPTLLHAESISERKSEWQYLRENLEFALIYF